MLTGKILINTIRDFLFWQLYFLFHPESIIIQQHANFYFYQGKIQTHQPSCRMRPCLVTLYLTLYLNLDNTNTLYTARGSQFFPLLPQIITVSTLKCEEETVLFVQLSAYREANSFLPLPTEPTVYFDFHCFNHNFLRKTSEIIKKYKKFPFRIIRVVCTVFFNFRIQFLEK